MKCLYLYFADSDNENGTVMLEIDADSGKVISFQLNEYADYIYKELSDE